MNGMIEDDSVPDGLMLPFVPFHDDLSNRPQCQQSRQSRRMEQWRND